MAALALAGCQLGTAPEPQPWRGPAPASLCVWPLVVGGAATEGLLGGLDVSLRGRGYRVPSLAVGATLLDEAQALVGADGSPADLAAVGQVLDVDALVVLSADRFVADVAPWRGAQWSLHWQIWSTRGHGLLWEYWHDGAWQRTFRDDGEPMPRLDDRLEPVPIGRQELVFRSQADLVAWLHRFASQRVPAAARRT